MAQYQWEKSIAALETQYDDTPIAQLEESKLASPELPPLKPLV